MGGFATLHLGLRHPGRARSLVVAACGYGAQPERQKAFREESNVIADAFAAEGAAEVAKRYAVGPARVQFQNKDPRGWAEFAAHLAEHSSAGSAMTMRGVQGAPAVALRPDRRLAARSASRRDRRRRRGRGRPRAEPHAEADHPGAGLAVLPKTGHTVNLEEPELFGRPARALLRRRRERRVGPARPALARDEHDGHGRARLSADAEPEPGSGAARGGFRVSTAHGPGSFRVRHPAPTSRAGTGGASGQAQASQDAQRAGR